jgi:predicted branched-subunit amino acid permease
VSGRSDRVPEAASTGSGVEVRRGALAAVPFVAGVAPFSMAYAVSALAAGFSPLETFLFSVLACSGSAQMASVGLAASGSGPLAIVLTALGLSLRHVLYGLSLATWLPRPSRPPTPLLAATVFDEGFGLATREAAEGRGSAGFLFGADGVLYLTWVAATLAGIVLGQLLPDPEAIGLGVIFPLSFLALLLPLIRTRRDAAVAVAAGAAALGLRAVVGAGPAVVVAIAGAAALGAALDRERAP